MAKKYKFTWDSFHSLSYSEKSYVLQHYILTTQGIVFNLFSLMNFYVIFYCSKNLLEVYNTMKEHSSQSLLEYNFRQLISYCKTYNFFRMKENG